MPLSNTFFLRLLLKVFSTVVYINGFDNGITLWADMYSFTVVVSLALQIAFW